VRECGVPRFLFPSGFPTHFAAPSAIVSNFPAPPSTRVLMSLLPPTIRKRRLVASLIGFSGHRARPPRLVDVSPSMVSPPRSPSPSWNFSPRATFSTCFFFSLPNRSILEVLLIFSFSYEKSDSRLFLHATFFSELPPQPTLSVYRNKSIRCQPIRLSYSCSSSEAVPCLPIAF